MLKALGPRLGRLAIGYNSEAPVTSTACTPQASLTPAMFRHCPRLAYLTLEIDLWADGNEQVAFKGQLLHT
jgi:hypothetical protein